MTPWQAANRIPWIYDLFQERIYSYDRLETRTRPILLYLLSASKSFRHQWLQYLSAAAFEMFEMFDKREENFQIGLKFVVKVILSMICCSQNLFQETF